jgi:hypothetical protein
MPFASGQILEVPAMVLEDAIDLFIHFCDQSEICRSPALESRHTGKAMILRGSKFDLRDLHTFTCGQFSAELCGRRRAKLYKRSFIENRIGLIMNATFFRKQKTPFMRF